MKSWVVRCRMDGDRVQLGPMGEDEAKTLLDGVRDRLDADATVADLADELRTRLPVGSRVVHTTTGDAGTVVCEADTAHTVDYRGAGQVYVRLDRLPSPSWFVADFFQPEVAR